MLTESHLLIDAGNSRVKWVWCEQPQQSVGQAHAEVQSAPKDSWLAHLAETSGNRQAASIWLSDVTGLPQTDLRRLQALFQCQPRRVKVIADCLNLVVAYPNPGNLGVDRWLAMLAAWQPDPRPLVVVDAGSALTVDLISAQGRHLGGWIAPGRRGLAAGLAELAPGLPEAQGSGEPLPANDTRPAITNARATMVSGLIQRAVDHLSEDSGRPAVDIEVVISGGDGPWVERICGQGDRMAHRPHLVLDGLRILLLNRID